jgi:hypothetical protein
MQDGETFRFKLVEGSAGELTCQHRATERLMTREPDCISFYILLDSLLAAV